MTTEIHAATEIGTLYHNDERSIDEKYGNQLAPYFQIEISDKSDNLLFSAGNIGNSGGYDLNGLIVNDVSMEEDIEGADAVDITINNPKVDLQNSILFDIGNNIDVWMGYDGRAPFYMMRGIIVEVQPEFPSDSIPTIKIKAYDKSYFMMEEGKAEIVPEGSAWWERRSQRSIRRQPEVETRAYNNAYGNTEPTEEQLADIERINEAAVAQGEDVQMREEGAETALDSDIDLTDTEIHRGEVTLPFDTEDDRDFYSDPSIASSNITTQPQSRLGWQQQRFNRRRRDGGKVWRGKTDAEIVAAIFSSYGIVPYVEATNESRRTFTGRSRPVTQNYGSNSERTGRPSSASVTEFDDIDEAEYQRIVDNATADETLEETRTRLASEDSAGRDPTLPPSPGGDYSPNRDTELQDAERIDSVTRQADLTNVRPINFTGADNQFISGTATVTRGHNAGARLNDYQFADDYRFRSVYEEDEDQTPPRMTRESRQREVTQKSGTTDWDFIVKLGEQHGFITFVFFHIDSHRWIGYWGPEGNVPQFRRYTFRYNAGHLTTLGTVRPNLSAKNQSTEIDLIYVDPVNGRENRLRVSMENISEYTEGVRAPGDSFMTNDSISNGPEVVLRVHGQRVTTHSNRRFSSAEDARLWLMSFWLEHARDFYFIEGDTIIGIPEMRAREYHFLEGIGRYSGEFFITQTIHSMSPSQGYKTSFVGRAKSPFREGNEQGDNMLVSDQTTLGESQPEPTTQEVLV